MLHFDRGIKAKKEINFSPPYFSNKIAIAAFNLKAAMEIESTLFFLRDLYQLMRFILCFFFFGDGQVQHPIFVMRFYFIPVHYFFGQYEGSFKGLVLELLTDMTVLILYISF